MFDHLADMGRPQLWWVGRVLVIFLLVHGILGWGKEGHYATCKIAEGFLTEDALEAVKQLLPDSAEGDLASVCSWPDEIRYNYHWRWTSVLHYVDTPDFKCNYEYCSAFGLCVTGAIYNYTMQLTSAYQDSNSLLKYNLTEALMFLSHFVGDVHQPLHVGFTGDYGGNTIIVRWFRRKTNLHHVWDDMIIDSALKTFYGSDLMAMIEAIRGNITDDWSHDVSSWENCRNNSVVCPNPYASESISLACKYAYRNATPGSTLEDDYFLSRLPVVEKRLAQGGIRLAAILNRVFASQSNLSSMRLINCGCLRRMSPFLFVLLVGLLFIWVPLAHGWSKEGHVMTCRIAQNLLEPEAAHAVQNLLPQYVNGDLSALCVWPDQIRHWQKYRWTSSLHFIDTPDEACSFDYTRDCHDSHNTEDMCVAGAIKNFTSQLLHYSEGTGDRRYNMTEALLFLSHFMGDIHQPMHVGFTSDEGGNTISLRWFRHKSNLHHVWDREIILTALADYYREDLNLLQQDIEGNFTDGIWSDDVLSWKQCDHILSCPNKYAAESINLACKWGYKGVKSGDTLSDDYFDSRMGIVMKRVAQGGVRLAMLLNRIFRDPQEFATST
ncbi:LOW QUALITY PROTEIN: S1-P1_nuclease domain-containing protein [Cephalotus follicularis]|uniref:Aspergillus nuclease S1 n=1 Tax=Cephalotus follicularis TaxID=3775 RepID=A0A1Q3AUY6_CEPFO|nr:LOW QUALITY PROTEIN: S1-P1_nuclease domain-containing protein [Cephalotus follicularis]